MTAKQVLEMQVNGSFNLLGERIRGVTDSEWTARAIPGTSLVGFVLWHGVRTIDMAVQTGIRGVPEMADRPQWAGRLQQQAAYGAGVSQAEADAVAHAVDRATAGDYLGEVRECVMAWLSSIADSDLAAVPEFERHNRARDRYMEPAVWAEVASLAGLPAWQILARPAVSHIRVHMGEVDTLLQALRAAAPAR